MKYFVDTAVLATDEGDYLKTLSCPLNKRWDHLVPTSDTDLKRRCNQCSKYVINLSSYTDEQAKALIEVDPHACVCINKDAENIEIISAIRESDLTYKRHEICVDDDNAHDCRIIRTARNLNEIKAAQSLPGYYLLPKIIEENPKIRQKLIIDVDEFGRLVNIYGDYRFGPGDEEVWYHPRVDTCPVAAYIVPSDIGFNEKVFIADLIEEHVGKRWNQGDVYKLQSAFALWDGEEFIYDIGEPFEAIG